MARLANITPSQIVVAALKDMDYVEDSTTDEWGITIGRMPAEPDNFVCVYDTTGAVDGSIIRTGEPILHHGIQIMVRSADYGQGWQKAKALQDWLCWYGKHELTIGAYTALFVAFAVSSPVSYIGVTEDQRCSLFSVNGLLTAREIF